MEGFEIYIIIFSVQIFRYALSTLRFALMARGEKIVNTMISFVLSISYILLVAKVFANLTTDPWQAVSYVLGSVVGTYIGMVFDEVSGLGQDILTVIVDIEKGNKLIDDIRKKGYAVTVVEGKGIKDDRYVLLIAINRKKEKKLMKTILKDDETAVVLRESVTTVGGYY